MRIETQIISILQEHPAWTLEEPEETYSSDSISITIGEITRRHIVNHLEKVIQTKGMQAVYASLETRE